MIMTKLIKKLGERLSFLQPYQVIILGFLFYVAIGTMLISLPFAQNITSIRLIICLTLFLRYPQPD